MSYRNNKLYQSLKDYVKVAVNHPNLLLITSPNPPFVFSQSVLQNLPEYRECFKTISEDEVISPQLNTTIGTNSGSYRIETDQLMNLLLHYLGIYKNEIVFNEEHFEESYLEFENTFYSYDFTYEVVAHLIGCVFESSFKIDDGLEICLVDRSGGGFLSDESHHEYGQWTIRVSYKIPKIVGQTMNDRWEGIKKDTKQRTEAHKKAEHVLICLRLLGLSRAYFQEVYHRRTTWIFPDARHYPIKFLPEYLYTDPREVSQEQFIEVWKPLAANLTSADISLTFAANRFSYAHERYEWEDRIVDLMIAAEILFLGNNKQRDKNRYIRDAVADLFGGDVQGKAKISKEMGLAYELRNNILHGNKIGLEETIEKIEKLDPSDNEPHFKRDMYTFRIQEYIRCSILRKLL